MFTEENTSFYVLYMYFQACLQRSRCQELRIATLVFAFHIFVSKVALVAFLTNCFQILNHLQCFSTGQDICLGKPLDDTLLQLVRQEVQQLSDSFDNRKDEDRRIYTTLGLLKSELDKAITTLQEKQAAFEVTCKELKQHKEMVTEKMSAKDKELEMCLESTQKVQNLCKRLEVKTNSMQQDLDLLKTAVESLPPHSEDFIDIVFDAPEQTKWFTEREKEIKNIEKCLPLNKRKELKMAAICGLGGCGKSTLATYFAWKRKQEYKGGVFWFSMEDDRKLESSVSDLALRLGIEANSFDFTLSKLLMWISKQEKPWLMVLDDVDQLKLSEQMHMILSGRWKRRACGHILLTTRRESREVCSSVDLEPSCCVEVFSFSKEEAKRFLRVRCGATSTGKEMELDELVGELGCLPLALEQAGAHIKALQCSIADYLESYKTQRVQLLNEHPRAKPLWEYESQNRLAVHTTWLLNFEYVKTSPKGELASKFLEASAFFAPNEIQEELINCQLLFTKTTCSFSLVKSQIVEILTKFSLFQRRSNRSLELHRLVQEVLRNRITHQETATAILTAAKLLHQAFQDCPSPKEVLGYIKKSELEQPSAFLTNQSLFYLWSKLTTHASELQQHLKTLLYDQTIEREIKTVPLTRETSRVIYENAVHLSVHGHHAEAKEIERFAIRIFDSCLTAERHVSKEDLTKLFPHVLPLAQVIQRTVLYSSRSPTDRSKPVKHVSEHSHDDDESLRLRGNVLFKKGSYKEAIEVYTKALESYEEGKQPDPRLLNNRATAYLKLRNFQQCLQDSKEYIKILPTCWKGYTRRALALKGLGLHFSALCSAAIAFFRDTEGCCRYEAFVNEFHDLEGQWDVADSSESLKQCLNHRRRDSSGRRVILVKNGQYDLSDIKNITNTALTALECSSDVTIKCNQLCFEQTCFFENTDFIAKESMDVTPNANVRFYKCSFRNCTAKQPVVSIFCGSATLIECTVKNSKGSGISAAGPNSSLSLIKCEISGHGSRDNGYAFGVRVFYRGRLLAHECRIHGNVRGIWLDEGPTAGVPAEGAIITDCEIYDNKYEGIVVGSSPHFSHEFASVIIRGNKIYHNGTFGVRSTLNINNVLFENNNVFENLWWGVCVHNNSGGVYKDNEISNNKMGGIMVGSQAPGKPPCIIVSNFIHHNCGPAYREGLRLAERDSFPEELQTHFNRIRQERHKKPWLSYNVPLPNMVMADFSCNRCFENDHAQKIVKTDATKAHCTFCFRHDFDLKTCKGCMTAKYCDKKCQNLHWEKHKQTCKAAGQKNSVEVVMSPLPPGTTTVIATHPSLQAGGPDLYPSPPRDGSRFIVKIQTFEEGFYGDIIDMRGFVSDEQDPYKARMVLYDRSRHVYCQFSGKPQLYHLIMECGVIGKMGNLTKKLYCWAAFKDAQTLRIFTLELPELQEW